MPAHQSPQTLTLARANAHTQRAECSFGDDEEEEGEQEACLEAQISLEHITLELDPGRAQAILDRGYLSTPEDDDLLDTLSDEEQAVIIRAAKAAWFISKGAIGYSGRARFNRLAQYAVAVLRAGTGGPQPLSPQAADVCGEPCAWRAYVEALLRAQAERRGTITRGIGEAAG